MDHHGRQYKKQWYDLFRPEHLEQAQPQIESWLSSPFGSFLVAKEREIITRLPILPGYHLLELGVSPSHSMLDSFDQLHRFNLNSAPSSRNGVSGAIADFEMLPLPSDILDTVVIHHAMEFSRRPHRVLNEAARVVAPGGHIVLFVLNPYSLFGLLKWPVQLFCRRQQLKYHSLRLSRMVDWLRLLHFKPMLVQRGGFGMAEVQGEEVTRMQQFGYGLGLPTGLFYVIVARKKVARLITDRGDLWNNLKIGKLGWRPAATSDSLLKGGLLGKEAEYEKEN